MRPLPCAAVGLLLGAALLPAAADGAGAKLQGSWVATAAQREGKPAADVVGHRVRFFGDKFQIRSKADKVLYEGTVRTDADKAPATVDFEHTAGELKGKVWKGIYSLDGDTLKICDNAADPAKPRPASFTTSADSGSVCVTFRRARPNTLTDLEKKAGFELLFDGKDLSGWEHKGNWKVEGGVIARADKGGGLTYTAKKVPDDFELRFDWKVARGSNSGVYYRPGQYEYQVLDNATHHDGKNPRTSAASLYFCMAPSRDVTRPVGEWNSGRIVCKGTVIQHWLNGVKVIDFDYADAKWAKEVDILRRRGAELSSRGAALHLQDHGDPVWYRSIRLRVIPADEKLERSDVTPAAIPEAALKYEQEVIQRIEEARKKAKK